MEKLTRCICLGQYFLKMLSSILPECQGGHEGDWWSRREPSEPSGPVPRGAREMRGPDSATKQRRDGLEAAGQVGGQHSCV